jgi:hypothetical protein
LALDSYRNSLDTFSTNGIGALHVLEATRSVRNTKVAVMITTDKLCAIRNGFTPIVRTTGSAVITPIQRVRRPAKSVLQATENRSCVKRASRSRLRERETSSAAATGQAIA